MTPTLQGKWTPWIVATASAFICWLAYVGPGIWPLAFVSWAPFVLAIRGQGTKRGTWIAFYAGTMMIAFGFYWLLGMLQTFSGFPLPLCALFALLLWAYQGGRYALTGWLALRAEQRGWSFSFAFVAAYATTELLYPLLFPYYWAAAMHEVPVMVQIADLGGPIMVSVVVMLVNVGVAEIVHTRLTGEGDKKVVYAAGGALLFTFAYGLFKIWSVGRDMEKAEAIHVGLVQGNLGLMQQHTAPDESKRRHLAATKQLKEKGAELVVWSESSVDYAAEESRKDTFYKSMITGGTGVPLIFGTVLIKMADSPTGKDTYFNSALSSDAQGNITGRYDKEYLLAFGEYLPLGATFPILYDWSPNSGRFTPGTKLDALPLGTHRIGVLICYEDIIPTYVNDIVKAEDPDLLVNITNDAWFGVTYEPWQHFALAKMRAIEHRRYLLRSTNSGVSAIVDPLGRTVVKTDVRDVQKRVKDPDSIDGTVRWMKSFTLYGAIGDWPWYLVALGSIGAAFRRKKPSDAIKLGSTEGGEGPSVQRKQEKKA